MPFYGIKLVAYYLLRLLSKGFCLVLDAFQFRSISTAGDIPLVSTRLPHGFIGLTGSWTDKAQSITFGKAQVIPIRNPFPFDELSSRLPRIAQREIMIEQVKLIPSSSWSASLANILSLSSWNALRDHFIDSRRACEECGDPFRLEAHELWSYDVSSRIQTLQSIRCLCKDCHATQHLGFANITGKISSVFDRLCKINRIHDEERESYLVSIFEDFESRSKIEWAVDISAAFSIVPSLQLKDHIFFGGDGWIWREATRLKPEMAVKLINLEIGSDGKRLHLVPSGSLSLAASHQ